MKKALLGLLVCGGVLLGVSGAWAQEAFIRETSGVVEVKAPGQTAWVPARAGQRLEQATLISTGFRSSALIVIGNSTITVRPLTRLTLEELSGREGTERVNINLRVGRVRADVTPSAGRRTNFTVRSPIATASVRGTSFEFDGIHLSVEEGRVYVTERARDTGGTYVSAGHTASTNIETGRTVSVAESAREELVLPLPAGVDNAPEVRPTPPQTGDLEVGVGW
jgi:hypothetical protein